MTAPGILPGGSTLFNGGFSRPDNQPARRSNVGVFGQHPGATPKWSRNRGRRDAEHRETMARLYIDMPEVARHQFLESLPQNVQNLAQVLTSTGYIDFLLTNAQESLQEKVQIVDTLTDNFVAFYSGQEPPLFQYNGTALNTFQDDQRVWLFRIYRNILRGSRLANRNLVVKLRYDSFIVTGYLESLGGGIDGDMGRTAGQFSFGMRVKSFQTFTPTLVHPSVVETPATQGVIFASEDAVSYDGTARSGAATAEEPPTALIGPAAASTSETDPREPPVSGIGRFAAAAAANAGNVTQDSDFGLSNVRGEDPDLLGLISNGDPGAFLGGEQIARSEAFDPDDPRLALIGSSSHYTSGQLKAERVQPRQRGIPLAGNINDDRQLRSLLSATP